MNLGYHSMYLKDINYTLLSLAIKNWKFRNRYFLTRNGLELFIPIAGRGFPYKKYNLAILSKYIFAWPEKILINLSYSFSSQNQFEDSDVKNVVNVLFNNIDNSIQQNNQRMFVDSVDNLEVFMRDIFSITSFINDNNKIDNWLLLSDNSFFSRNLLDEFMREYYSLNSIVIDKTLDMNTDFYFRKFCYFFQYTFYDDIKVHNEIQRALMQAHYNLWVELIKNDILKLKPYFDSLCKEYIGGWESWSNREDKDIANWDNASYNISNTNSHLEFSCRQIITAIRYENHNASFWATNILNNWAINYDLDHGNNQYIWKTNILSPSIFLGNQNSEIVNYITNNDVNINDLYKISLINNFVQSRIITASYILNKKTSQINNLDRQIIFALLNGDEISPTNVPKMSFNYHNVDKILETYILNSSCFWRITQNGIALILIKAFKTIYEKEYISGRVNISHGRDGLSSIKDSFIVLLICNSSTSFDLSRNIYDFIFSSLFPQQNRDDLIRVLKEFININDNINDKAKKILNLENIDSLVEKYLDSINKIIEKLEHQNNEIVFNEEISEDRINAIKAYCSKSAFNKDSAGIPLSLFNNINYTLRLDNCDKKEINLSNINKRELIDGELNRAVNEEDFYANMLKDQVYIHLFRKIFNDITYQDKEFNDKKELLVNILDDCSNKENMIIFVGATTVSSYLYSLFWDKNEDIPFNITEEEGYDNNYICHLNNVPTYAIRNFDINFCLLLDKNLFEELDINKYDENIYVDVEYKENEVDLANSNLLISYCIKTTLNTVLKNYKYVLTNDD